ncbi:MAG: ABC transporter ATP-binding protein [Ardenticatenaceae bacterium]|nr:ABC transporter ATP-binding protein [Ardenticatenaceae bacterium]HBY99000.1 branched-chain amino acid ABC transporter ATP-binding protein [Chloroflexota bacterium]
MALLEIRDLESGYGEVQILWDASLQLERGRLTTLVGSNGVGKTTLLRSVMGLIRPWSGSVIFDGRDVTNLSAHTKVELGLVLVPEGRQLFTDMTVYENLEMGAVNRRARPHFRRNLGWVYEVFPRLQERQKQPAGTLSGGEQQMLAVARGIMAEPRILMIDELSLGLAPVLAIGLFETLRELKQTGLTMLLVEQNVHLALAISDYAYVLSQGRITLQGEAREVARKDEVRAAYLGI